VQTEKFLEGHDRDRTAISVFGQENNDRTWRMAKMNLAIHGLNANLGTIWGDTFARDQHPDVQMDYVLANPPFNIKDWARNDRDGRWRYGVPPVNNANYAWLQHIIHPLAPGGSAGVVLANGSMSTNTGGEGAIRAQIVDADLVSCMVALPTQLFRSTGIPVCLWFFALDKGPSAGRVAGEERAGVSRPLADRRGQVLFIDARELGFMQDRAHRAFTDADIARIADTYHAWRGTTSARDKGLEYADQPGFCASATLKQVADAGYALTPGRYVGAPEVVVDAAEVRERIDRLTWELLEQLDESERLAQVVREQLGRVR
ncbi:MAG TPA: N-6 DNA methylase, partial [Propionibacteriaceae bacterium]|nr:N-6 DNA methylase [Propionibacteriaceae bacterium]